MKVHSVVLLSLFLGSATAQAQGLADAAQKEKEKREAKAKAASAQESKPGAKPPEAKVYTGDDLAGYAESRPAEGPSNEGAGAEGAGPEGAGDMRAGSPGSVGSMDGSPIRVPGSSAESRSKGRSGVSDDSAARAGQERSWRSRAESARAVIVSAEKELAAAEQAKSGLGIQPDGRDKVNPGLEQNKWRSGVQDAGQRVKRAQSMLDSAKRNLDRLEEDARRQGVPPGWLR